MISDSDVTADPLALCQELALKEPIDISSPAFQRFVIRLSERLDHDIPREDYPRLATIGGCFEYISRLSLSRLS